MTQIGESGNRKRAVRFLEISSSIEEIQGIVCTSDLEIHDRQTEEDVPSDSRFQRKLAKSRAEHGLSITFTFTSVVGTDVIFGKPLVIVFHVAKVLASLAPRHCIFQLILVLFLFCLQEDFSPSVLFHELHLVHVLVRVLHLLLFVVDFLMQE